jgi:hypothetical protein
MMNNNTIISMCYLSKILDVLNNLIYIEGVVIY